MEGKSSYGGNVEYLKATELKLAPPGTDNSMQEATSGVVTSSKKRAITGPNEQYTQSKVQAVGWPPVRAQRMNSFRSRKNEVVDHESGGVYVKVRMDGAPYLRNIDLKNLQGYKELRVILEGMFKCSSLGAEGYHEKGYAIAYEDRDGDLMLVGDVPWEMFVSSCQRLRIMKWSEARGLSS